MSTKKNALILYSPSGDREQDEVLLEPYNYMGLLLKDSVTLEFADLFNHWLNIPKDKLIHINNITRILCNYYLIFDDVVDNSALRRGVPTTHVIYGVGHTLNSSCYAANIGWEESFLLHPDAPKYYLEQMLLTHRGQGLEIVWRDQFICPTEQEYIIMAKQKISLLAMVFKMMQLFSDNKKNYTDFALNLGAYLQIFDDYLCLFGKEYMEQKGIGDDITEGKFSFPILHAINQDPDDKRLIEILKKRTTDTDLKKYFISLLVDKGSRDYTLKKLATLRGELKEQIKLFGGNPFAERILDPDRKLMV